jgi:hypothetical protein
VDNQTGNKGLMIKDNRQLFIASDRFSLRCFVLNAAIGCSQEIHIVEGAARVKTLRRFCLHP